MASAYDCVGSLIDSTLASRFERKWTACFAWQAIQLAARRAVIIRSALTPYHVAQAAVGTLDHLVRVDRAQHARATRVVEADSIISSVARARYTIDWAVEMARS